jgi:DnaJ-class molecular chaperone
VRGGEPGDAIVTVKIAPHPYFKLDGRDLRLDLPVAIYEAALGAKVQTPTLDGKVELAVPAGSNGGRVLRLRGKGLPASDSKPAGDLYVALKIITIRAGRWGDCAFRHCERREAIQSHVATLDCFVASLLAMTAAVSRAS